MTCWHSDATSSVTPTAAPTALPDADLPRLFDAPGAIQLVQAGNLRSSLRILELAVARGRPRPHRARDRYADRHRRDAARDDQDRLRGLLARRDRRRRRAWRWRRGATRRSCGAPRACSRWAGPPTSRCCFAAARFAPGTIRSPRSSTATSPGSALCVIDGEVRALRSRNTPAPCGRGCTLTGGTRVSGAAADEAPAKPRRHRGHRPAREARVGRGRRGQVLADRRPRGPAGRRPGGLQSRRPGRVPLAGRTPCPAW